jgi:thiosulfate dehydrogenase [quinone] large subunit
MKIERADNGHRRPSRRTALRALIAVAIAPIAVRLSAAPAEATGKRIVRLTKLPIGSTFTFTTSTQGMPAIIFRTKNGVFAYSMICTHQGGSLSYNRRTKQLDCPVHQAKFDPLKGARVVSGPAERPLTKVRVAIKAGWVVEA